MVRPRNGEGALRDLPASLVALGEAARLDARRAGPAPPEHLEDAGDGGGRGQHAGEVDAARWQVGHVGSSSSPQTLPPERPTG